jgi:hypothetical protein
MEPGTMPIGLKDDGDEAAPVNALPSAASETSDGFLASCATMFRGEAGFMN